MGFKLVVVGGEAKGKVIDIDPPTVIGRSKEANITVGHGLISRRHCEITVNDDGSLMLQDLGSLNGTLLGTEKIEGLTRLEPGGRFTVGNITFEAQYGDFEPPPADQTEDFNFTMQDTPVEPDTTENEKAEEVPAFEPLGDEPETTEVPEPSEAPSADENDLAWLGGDVEESSEETPASGDKSKPTPPSEDDLSDFLSGLD